MRCDIPAHVYQSGFAPNTQWSEEFAQGAEIRDYWQGIAKKYNVYQYLRLRQQVEKAEWVPEKAKWTVTLQDLSNSQVCHSVGCQVWCRDANLQTYDEELDIVITAIGHFNAWKLPEYKGIDKYQGTLFHSSSWDHNIDLNNKHIALIGNGASGLQVLPSIQPQAQRVDHYARNRTWIADSFGTTGVRRLEPNFFTTEQRESFKDPQIYLSYRRQAEKGYFQRFGAIFRDSPENHAQREQWTELMLRRIGDNPDLADKIIPDFPPNCRRPTPGPGYLEALTKDNVNYIQTPISHFTETGLVTTDGTIRDVDVVICATGANIDHAPPFPIRANGYDLNRDWKHTGTWGFPYTYLGVATPHFPNLLYIGGPYSSGHSGTVPNGIENQTTYIAKVLRKVRGQGIQTITPSQQAADDFVEYCDAFYPRTVWSANCRSWYNGGRPGGRIHGLFPGSATHVNMIRREPRWEDWEYTYTNPSGNRFGWFGNGWTSRELRAKDDSEGEGRAVDLTPHLRVPEEVDLRTYMEGWWDV